MKEIRNSRRIVSRSASILSAVVFLFVPFIKVQSQDLLPDLVRRIKPSAVAIETFDSRGEKLSRAAASLSQPIASYQSPRHRQRFPRRSPSSNGSVYPVKV